MARICLYVVCSNDIDKKETQRRHNVQYDDDYGGLMLERKLAGYTVFMPCDHGMNINLDYPDQMPLDKVEYGDLVVSQPLCEKCNKDILPDIYAAWRNARYAGVVDWLAEDEPEE